jgi:hypothetical protein
MRFNVSGYFQLVYCCNGFFIPWRTGKNPQAALACHGQPVKE